MLRPPLSSTLFPYTTLFRSDFTADGRIEVDEPDLAPFHQASSESPALLNSPISNRSEEHTSELQSLRHLVCRLLLEKKKKPRTAGSPLRSTITLRTT